jgi:hypothetical protein
VTPACIHGHGIEGFLDKIINIFVREEEHLFAFMNIWILFSYLSFQRLYLLAMTRTRAINNLLERKSRF